MMAAMMKRRVRKKAMIDLVGVGCSDDRFSDNRSYLPLLASGLNSRVPLGRVRHSKCLDELSRSRYRLPSPGDSLLESERRAIRWGVSAGCEAPVILS